MGTHVIVTTSMGSIYLFAFVMWLLGAAVGVLVMLPWVRRRGR